MNVGNQSNLFRVGGRTEIVEKDLNGRFVIREALLKHLLTLTKFPISLYIDERCFRNTSIPFNEHIEREKEE